MSRFPLEIRRYMSSVILVIDPSQTLADAIRVMRLHEVRHLPVVSKGRIVGLISQRDIYLMRSIEASDPSQIQIGEAMTKEPYTVEPEEPVDLVARQMVRRKIGSALVAHGDRLVGLFTGTDALLALAALVEDDRVPSEEEVEVEPRPRPKSPGPRPAPRPARKGADRPKRAKSGR